MTKEDYEKLVPIFKESGIMIITDEIYAELSYEHKFCSIASFDEIKDQVILVSGFSKAYAMTGWRLGYVLANEYLVKMMKKIHQYVIMSAPTCAQYGAIEAMRRCDEEIEKDVYKRQILNQQQTTHKNLLFLYQSVKFLLKEKIYK